MPTHHEARADNPFRPGTRRPEARPTPRRGRAALATVVNVRDGDTIDVIYHEAQNVADWPLCVRLAAVDAPEYNAGNDDAARAAHWWLQTKVDGQEVTIAPTHTWPDRYGRLIARVYLAGKDINNQIVQAGLARYYSTRLARLARHRANGAQPTSATPNKKLSTPPGTTTGLPANIQSSRTATPGEHKTQPT
jgi:endonuclease YncB( thermonuclease family)